MRALVSTLLAAALGLAGCASQPPVPPPTVPTTGLQPKYIAAEHWRGFAADVATRLAAALGEAVPEGETLVVYLEPPRVSTTFSESFYDLLTTELMQQGFGVIITPGVSPLVISYDIRDAGPADYDVAGSPVALAAQDRDILINVSVTNDDRFVTRISEIFYINADTRGEYFAASPPPPARRVEVVGP
ncbi:MAG: hypothetical protein ACFCBW_20545 [Candidatus Competibacterales bacterium]